MSAADGPIMMTDETTPPPPAADPQAAEKVLSPAAQRALAEAAERRAKAAAEAHAAAKEVDGPKGLEPTRYGDWERKGIASDF
uniref:DUF1674 domain-containing protein n=1 Tax=Rhodopseudomonas palustris (strain BisA53) TaxID=316055 RepID=Q07VP4_RHOP5